MPGNERNRNSIKGSDKENRTGNQGTEKDNYRKLPDNPKHKPDESISTADDTANGKYSKTGKRDDEVNKEDTRGGR
jgi:hypothetical protein